MDSVWLLHRPWFFSRDDFHVLVGDFELAMSRGHRLEWLAPSACLYLEVGPKPSLKDDQYPLLFWESVSVCPGLSVPFPSERRCCLHDRIRTSGGARLYKRVVAQE